MMFIVQIAPSGPLKSTSLLSNKEDLLHDYELGVEAGNRFINFVLQAGEIKAEHIIRADFNSPESGE